jgi:nitroimidazol reductase NimA-like FMN-containing flavoprotein (pyridoxamine 5'-phosphate oxidase superfamily)
MSSESRDQTFVKKQMPTKFLEERIIEFLKKQNMCVLATCGDGLPRATPIEYHSKGITIYFVGEPGEKIKNITDNPNVSIGIFLPYTGWDSAKGAQITGRAKIISRQDHDGLREGLEAYQWEKTAKQLNIKEFPKTVELVKVDPEKIEYVDISLKKMGYSPRQTLALLN